MSKTFPLGVGLLLIDQAKRAKLKAQLDKLARPTKSQRRIDARRKILVGAFILEELEHAGLSPQALTYNNKRFFDWLVRPNDRAVFDTLSTPTQKRATTGSATTETALNVPFADKDQAKALGAIWHPDQKRWVVPAGLELEPFKAWLE
jgi:hypothetical protein